MTQTHEWLDALEARFKAEETEGWRKPANRTTREYAARQARMAVAELRYKIAKFDNACKAHRNCDAESDNGRVISNRPEDYCKLPQGHEGLHSWDRVEPRCTTPCSDAAGTCDWRCPHLVVWPV